MARLSGALARSRQPPSEESDLPGRVSLITQKVL